mmetsp:Transcript_8669/g.26615  ORF Transcript_8669/g.26615 Transcript_8669/m.26615 type:complete len:453 (-) Transcript_8669:190-1548(-)
MWRWKADSSSCFFATAWVRRAVFGSGRAKLCLRRTADRCMPSGIDAHSFCARAAPAVSSSITPASPASSSSSSSSKKGANWSVSALPVRALSAVRALPAVRGALPAVRALPLSSSSSTLWTRARPRQGTTGSSTTSKKEEELSPRRARPTRAPGSVATASSGRCRRGVEALPPTKANEKRSSGDTTSPGFFLKNHAAKRSSRARRLALGVWPRYAASTCFRASTNTDPGPPRCRVCHSSAESAPTTKTRGRAMAATAPTIVARISAPRPRSQPHVFTIRGGVCFSERHLSRSAATAAAYEVGLSRGVRSPRKCAWSGLKIDDASSSSWNVLATRRNDATPGGPASGCPGSASNTYTSRPLLARYRHSVDLPAPWWPHTIATAFFCGRPSSLEKKSSSAASDQDSLTSNAGCVSSASSVNRRTLASETRTTLLTVHRSVTLPSNSRASPTPSS